MMEKFKVGDIRNKHGSYELLEKISHHQEYIELYWRDLHECMLDHTYGECKNCGHYGKLRIFLKTEEDTITL